MTSSSRSFMYSALLTIGISSLLIIALNGHVDPWRFFYDSGLARWDGDGRQQNPGIVRQEKFSVAVFGTSLTQNFQPDELEQLFGGDAAVLSISAGTGREQALTAELALQKQSLSTVVWGVHPGSFILPAHEVKGNAFPSYLYDDHWLNDVYYLFNVSNTEKALKDLVAYFRESAVPESSASKSLKSAPWQNLQYWGDEYSYGCPSVLALQMSRRGLPVRGDDFWVADEQITNNVRENLLATVRAHPQTQFKFFFPPFSHLYWSLLAERQPMRYAAYRRLMKEVVIQLSGEANVELFDFTSLAGVVGDLENYRDIIHFSPLISSGLLHLIKAGEHRVIEADLGKVGNFTDLMSESTIQSRISTCLQVSRAG